MSVIMAHAGLHENLNTGLWPICASTPTKLENILVNLHKEKCACKNFYGKIPDFAKHFSTIVEMGVICSILNVKFKLYYQGMMCMFLGYAKNHTGVTYRVLNIHMKNFVLSYDLIWPNKTYC